MLKACVELNLTFSSKMTLIRGVLSEGTLQLALTNTVPEYRIKIRTWLHVEPVVAS